MKDILTITDVSKKYGNEEVLNKISINIQKGGLYGLIGPNGAGKSTLFKILAGLVEPDSGQITIDGDSNIADKRKQMGFMIEQPYLDFDLSARENLELLCCIKNVDKKDIDYVLNAVQLADTEKKKVGKFSLGMKQRLGIAMALIGNPNLLVLDEPINGLDPIGVIEMRNLIKKLNQDMGITVILSSHILSELDQLATDYIIINKGNIIEEVSADNIRNEGNIEEYFIKKIGMQNGKFN